MYCIWCTKGINFGLELTIFHIEQCPGDAGESSATGTGMKHTVGLK